MTNRDREFPRLKMGYGKVQEAVRKRERRNKIVDGAIASLAIAGAILFGTYSCLKASEQYDENLARGYFQQELQLARDEMLSEEEE